MSATAHDLAHARQALAQALAILRRHAAGPIDHELKVDGPVTAADREVDAFLRSVLPRGGEGWLSEESIDDHARLRCDRVWVVDPVDGTRAFVAGRPEYSVAIGLVENGEPVLGAIGNPATGVVVSGGPGLGIGVDGDPALPWRPAPELRVLCSRSEWRRGDWQPWLGHPALQLLPMGSVAYKLALIAAGAADATWTFSPKSEWDVAGGVALVVGAGGRVWLPDGRAPRWNQASPRFPGMVACRGGVEAAVRSLL